MELNEKGVLMNTGKSKSPCMKAPLLKIVLVGDSDVGKTTLINCFINDGLQNENFKKSVGVDYTVKQFELKKNVTLRLEIWDTAGNDKFRTMISTYYRGAHGIIIVFDNSNIKSFYSLKNWMKEIKQFASETSVKYLVCNKSDKVAQDTTVSSNTWTICEEEVEKFALKNSLKYTRTSSLNNVGIKELFQNIASDILDSLDDEKIHMRSESIKLGYINNKEFFNSPQKAIRDEQNTNDSTFSSCCYKN